MTGIAIRQRLDAELVRRQLVATREAALELIEADRVQVNGSFARNAARLVDRGDNVQLVSEGPKFVSRGGLKLERALDAFALDVSGRRVLDVGASTGGFTDCLLQRGAHAVVAVDVGYGQLHESLVADRRVTNLERTNIRSVLAAQIGPPFSLVVADLSFLSLGAVLADLVSFIDDGADLIVLVKPQFEANKLEADQGQGIIRDPAVWQRVLEEVQASAEAAGAPLQGAVPSPVRGAAGNVEFLFHLVMGAGRSDVDLAAVVAEAQRAD